MDSKISKRVGAEELSSVKEKLADQPVMGNVDDQVVMTNDAENGLFNDNEEAISTEGRPELDVPEDAPILTFRVFLISSLLTYIVGYVNQIGSYRTVSFSIDTVVVFIVSFPLLKMISEKLPNYRMNIGSMQFDLNPKPFNIREHLLISVISSDAAGSSYVANTLYFMEYQLHDNLGWMGDFLLIASTKLVGYGIAGVTFKLLIEPAMMVWPQAIYTAELFRMLHDGTKSRLKVFTIVAICVFCYSFLPNLLMPVLGSFAVLCFFNGSSTGNQDYQIMSRGYYGGFGLGSFDFNPSNIWGYFSYVCYVPVWAGMNMFVGGVLYAWVICPIVYWSDFIHAKNFQPVTSLALYMKNGTIYDVASLFDDNNEWNQEAYDAQGSLYMTGYFAMCYWFSFLGLPASLSTVVCYHRAELKAFFTGGGFSKVSPDAKYMNEHHKPIPQWWGLIVLLITVGISVATVEGYNVDMPWWAVLVSIGIAVVFIIPIGIIQAITSVQVGINVLAEIIGGLMLKHNPVGAILVKVYGYMGMAQGINLVSNLKIGQYMRVPYKKILAMQLWGTVVTALADTTAYRQVMDNNLLDPKDPTPGWNPRGLQTYVSASYLWGGVGPWEAIMGPNSPYMWVFWSGTIAGFIIPVILYTLGKKWDFFNYVSIPLLTVVSAFPVETAWVSSILLLSIGFQVVLKRVAPRFHKKHLYVTVGGVSLGSGLNAFVIAMLKGFGGMDWEPPVWLQQDAGCKFADE
eukprot:Nk52_evm6s147 gene=Nk52_evmTU6s147